MENYNTEFLSFYKIGDKPKTEVWAIDQRQGGARIGEVKWYGPWRRYVIHHEPGTHSDKKCLDEIALFLGKLMIEHKSKREARKK